MLSRALERMDGGQSSLFGGVADFTPDWSVVGPLLDKFCFEEPALSEKKGHVCDVSERLWRGVPGWCTVRDVPGRPRQRATDSAATLDHGASHMRSKNKQKAP